MTDCKEKKTWWFTVRTGLVQINFTIKKTGPLAKRTRTETSTVKIRTVANGRVSQAAKDQTGPDLTKTTTTFNSTPLEIWGERHIIRRNHPNLARSRCHQFTEVRAAILCNNLTITSSKSNAKMSWLGNDKTKSKRRAAIPTKKTSTRKISLGKWTPQNKLKPQTRRTSTSQAARCLCSPRISTKWASKREESRTKM